ncbi:apolipoprotein Eb-like isoform X3 [Anolis sagrei]|uniref:apolipoprotein Eb-like isoform X3 n=1 Tax=Anolis sagrei TaxID=38937 RepID=UPI003522B28D
MKLLVVLFALAVVTGGRAVTTREAPSSEPKLRELLDKVTTIGINGFFITTRIFAKIVESEPIREQLDQIAEKLQKQERELPLEMREMEEIVSNLSDGFKEKIPMDLHAWKRRHYKESEGIMDALAVYVDPVASKAVRCMEWLEQNVGPVVIKMYEPYEGSVDQAIESLGSTLTEKLQTIMESLQTSLDGGAKQIQLGLETLNKHLKPYWIPFLKEYKKYDPAIREWMESPLFPPPKKD